MRDGDSLPVFVSANKVDQANRCIGIVPPEDSKVFKLPYVDTRVTITTADTSNVINVDKPFIWRLIIKK
jgi:hypothetical protein